jgi:exonuclease III
LREIATRPLATYEQPDLAYKDQILEVSQPGLIAAADVLGSDGEQLLTVASVYGLNADKTLNGVRYATSVVHRILSDLTPLLDTYRGKRRTILGGDLNVSPQIAYPDTTAHEIVIDRLKAFGMIDCLGRFNDDFVQTHRARKSTKPWQDDWVFASRHLTDSLLGCEALSNDEIWGLSDHCPVVLSLEL